MTEGGMSGAQKGRKTCSFNALRDKMVKIPDSSGRRPESTGLGLLACAGTTVEDGAPASNGTRPLDCVSLQPQRRRKVMSPK
jgi:hypothetical protein